MVGTCAWVYMGVYMGAYWVSFAIIDNSGQSFPVLRLSLANLANSGNYGYFG